MEITLTSKPSPAEVKAAAEILLYEADISDEQWQWACEIIKAHKEQS